MQELANLGLSSLVVAIAVICASSPSCFTGRLCSCHDDTVVIGLCLDLGGENAANFLTCISNVQGNKYSFLDVLHVEGLGPISQYEET